MSTASKILDSYKMLGKLCYCTNSWGTTLTGLKDTMIVVLMSPTTEQKATDSRIEPCRARDAVASFLKLAW